jgi:Raf kinase inhibitor-like YbhB/YbcL family protein
MSALRTRCERRLLLALLISAGCGLVSWHDPFILASADEVLVFTTSSFRAGGDIPARFTCEGADDSPALSWKDPPDGTRSFALVMDDPDAPGGDFVHWVIYDLPASTHSLPEGVVRDPEAEGGHQGINGFGRTGYSGPCPPPGRPHRYFIRLWALDTAPNLQKATAEDLESAIRGHILAHGEIMGRFRR